MTRRHLAALAALPLVPAVAAGQPDAGADELALVCPVPDALPADELIQPGETHFARLWKITAGGQNAEGYFAFSGRQLVFQRTDPDDEAAGDGCDAIYVTCAEHGGLRRVSSGRGVTTCAYFLPGDRQVLFASTQAHMEGCPPPADHSQGYTWRLHPEYDLWLHDLETGAERRLTEEWGYDAEATISPRGDRMVFTSTRSGDAELWTCALDGTDPVQVTDRLGYDGGAFFSHDGRRLVFRATEFPEGDRQAEVERYRALLSEWKVRPHSMEIYVCDADGSNRRRVTSLGGANFAPYFFPDDRRILFATNHHEESQRNFDLFAIGVDGQGLERVTTYDGFDSFPQFSPDGRFLVFASNRGGSVPGETNLFLAAWR